MTSCDTTLGGSYTLTQVALGGICVMVEVMLGFPSLHEALWVSL